MDTLRIVLLIIGAFVILGIYLWEIRRRRRSNPVAPTSLEQAAPADDEQVERELQRLSGLVASSREDLPAGVDAGTEAHAERSQANPIRRAPGSAPTPASATGAQDEPEPTSPPISSPPILRPVAPRKPQERAPKVDIPPARELKDAQAAQSGAVRGSEPRELIISLTLLAPQGMRFSGEQLLAAVKQVGMVYGDRGIFHRPPPGDPTGPPLFSLANILKPGYFDLDQIEAFSTPGLAVFMRLPGALRGSDAFRDMVDTVDQLAAVLDAQVCDARRRPIDSAALQALWDKVIAFDHRQSRMRTASRSE